MVAANFHQFPPSLFLCLADDMIANRLVTIDGKYVNAKKKKTQKQADHGTWKDKANLPDMVKLAVGMQVMVTFNIETDLDVANRAQGVIEESFLTVGSIFRVNSPKYQGKVALRYPPECILVRLNRTKAQRLPELAEGVIPIVPMEQKYDLQQKDGKNKQVTRRQLPMTTAYAFTDYRSQGQTITQLGERLLCDFQDDLFTETPCEKLNAEDKVLQDLNFETKRRWEAGETVWDHDNETKEAQHRKQCLPGTETGAKTI
ncbi:hypothetical protein FRC06_010349 [Ceratobasidium sp. 370]|nr:hypothetical protein FRC06_010349 [Ceratobasidium sp. 370]